MRKILIVDEDKNVRISLSIGLGRKGHLVDVAKNAQVALIKLKEECYDFVLTDIIMPDIGGFVLATIINQLYPEVQIILMSTSDFKDYEGKHKQLDKCPKLSKPFGIATLLELLQK
jgi:DNA-binding NtrC family response regulator